MNKTILTFSIAAMTLFSLSSCEGSKKDDVEAEQIEAVNEHGNSDSEDTSVEDTNEMEEEGALVGEEPSKDIVEHAMSSKDQTTLVTAIKAADLVDTLKSEGPFTVFAPTNNAFGMLPKGTIDNLLKPENKAKLTKVLTYHVVPGAYKSADLRDGQVLKTIEGEELKITEKNDVWMVNGVKIKVADIFSSNGVTYVIDKVLMPGKM